MPGSIATQSKSAEFHAGISGDMKFHFDCPNCRDQCWVEWKHLNKALRCRKCNARIRIERSQIETVPDDRARIKFNCPRCKFAGSLATNVAARGTQCTACELPLFLGPDGQLYSAEDLERVVEQAARPKQVAWSFVLVAIVAEKADRLFRSRAMRWPLVCLAGVLLVATIVGAVQAFRWLAGSDMPEAYARAFTQSCLDGRKDDPLAFVGDDPVQLVEFNRWRMRHMVSMHAHVRPEGDQVAVNAEPLEVGSDRCAFRVTMTSPFMGERATTQWWRHQDDRWWFDAATTIDKENNALPSVTPPPAAARGPGATPPKVGEQ
jgi:hypothetical protein